MITILGCHRTIRPTVLDGDTVASSDVQQLTEILARDAAQKATLRSLWQAQFTTSDG